MSVFASKEDFEVSVYDAVCTAEGYRCVDGREFTAFDFNSDAETESDLLDSDIEKAFNACINHIDELARSGYCDSTDYEEILEGHI